MLTNKQLEKSLRQVNKILRKKTTDFEYSLLLHYKKMLEKIRKDLFNIYLKYGQDVSFAEMSKYERLSSLEKQIDDEIKNISGVSVDLIGKEIKSSFTESYKLTVNALSNILPFEVEFIKLNPEVISEAIKYKFDRVKWQKRRTGHHEKAIEQIKTEITQGLIQGKGYSKTSANIKENVNALANNMLRIVRTESHRVQVLGSNIALDKSVKAGKKFGVNLVKVILAIKDGKQREQSDQMHGQEADDNGLFTYPNGVKGLPGNTGVAAYDINDREVVIIKIV